MSFRALALPSFLELLESNASKPKGSALSSLGVVSSAGAGVSPPSSPSASTASAEGVASSMSSSSVADGRPDIASLIFPAAFENYMHSSPYPTHKIRNSIMFILKTRQKNEG